MPDQLKDKVKRWLEMMGCTPVEQQDPATEWRFRIDYPIKGPHQMHVLSPKARPFAVVVASGGEIGHDLHEAFEQLDDDAKNELLWELRGQLNEIDVEFQLDGAKSQMELPRLFQVSAIRYEDGLTLDELAWTIGAVFKTELKGGWVLQRHLGQRGFGGGGRFDFKRIGM